MTGITFSLYVLTSREASSKTLNEVARVADLHVSIDIPLQRFAMVTKVTRNKLKKLLDKEMTVSQFYFILQNMYLEQISSSNTKF